MLSAPLVIAGDCVNLVSAMPRLQRQNYHDIERIIEFDFVRATEAAALNSLQWLGRGDKEAADAAACDAIRGMFDLMNICGEVVIGEGIKDDAPGIFKGEQLGHVDARFAAVRHRHRSDRWHHQYFQRRAELDRLHRGGEPGGRSESRAARYPLILHEETFLRPARDPIHAKSAAIHLQIEAPIAETLASWRTR